ncbi:hypothetical protein ABH925_007529 [Streptacidiphilus sp. EB129]|jgi:hypothetical protein
MDGMADADARFTWADELEGDSFLPAVALAEGP